MRRYLVLPAAIMLLIVLLVSGCGESTPAPAPSTQAAPATGAVTPETAEPIEVTLITSSPASRDSTRIQLEVINAINERMQGKLFVKHVGSTEVIPLFEQPMAVKNGVVDMVITWSGSYESLVQGTNPIMTLLPDNGRESGVHDLLVEMHKPAGLYFVGVAATSPNHERQFTVFLNKKVSTPQELSGLRIVAEATMVEIAEALGMEPISVPDEELYTSVQQGMVDAYFNPVTIVDSLKLYEVTKYYIDHCFWYAANVCLMNLDKWNQIPQPLQQEFTSIFVEKMNEVGNERDALVVNARQHLADAGMEAITFSPADAEYYISVPLQAQFDRFVPQSPEYGPKLLELYHQYYED